MSEVKKFKKKEELKTPTFVGHGNILKDLKAALLKAHQGNPSFVMLNAEDGMGKSRIVEELKKETEDVYKDEIKFIEQTCEEKDDRAPFLRIVHTSFLFYKNLGRLKKEHLVGNPPMGLDQEFVEFAVSGYQEETIENIFDNVEIDPAKISSSIASFLRSHTHAGTVCWIIEESHATDRRSAEFLSFLTSALEEGDRFLGVIVYHGDEPSGENSIQRVLPHLRSQKKFKEIKIPPLLARAIPTLLRSMIGPLQVDDQNISDIYKTTRGKPYHMIAFIHTLAENNCIVWEEDSWQLEITRDLLKQLPKDVEEMLVNNVTKLGKHHQSILMWITLSERSLDLKEISSILGLAIGQTSMVVEDLVTKKYLQKEENDKEKLYDLSSNKTGAKLFEKTQEKQLQKMHAQIAKVLLKLNKGPHLLPFIAEHYVKSGDEKKAFQYSLQASEWLTQEGKFAQAFRYYRKVYGFAKKSKKNVFCDFLLKAGSVLYKSGKYDQAQKHYEEASSLASKKEIGVVQKGRGLCLYGLRKHNKARDTLRNYLKSNPSETDSELFLGLSFLETERYHFKKAEEYLTQSQSLIEQKQQKILKPVLLKNQIWLHFFLGQWQNAKECYKEVYETLKEDQREQLLSEILLGYLPVIYYSQGISEAQILSKELLGITDSLDDWYIKYQSYYWAGMLALEQGAFKKSQECWDKIAHLGKERGNDKIDILLHIGQSSLLLVTHELEESEKVAELALKKANGIGESFLASEAYYLLGEISLFTKKLPNAQKYLKYAMDGYKKLNVLWKTQHVLVSQAKLLRAAKQLPKAMKFLVSARKEVQKMENNYLLADIALEQGLILHRNNEKEKAIEYFKQAKKLYSDQDRTVALKQMPYKMKDA